MRGTRHVRRRWVQIIAAGALLVVLRDPPWLGAVTSGLSPWMHEVDGTRFRWTTGHATFYVPSAHRSIVLRLRAEQLAPGFLPAVARLEVDGRLVDAVRLDDEVWHEVPIRVGALPATRRHRRIEVRVNRTYGRLIRGIKLGEVRSGP